MNEVERESPRRSATRRANSSSKDPPKLEHSFTDLASRTYSSRGLNQTRGPPKRMETCGESAVKPKIDAIREGKPSRTTDKFRGRRQKTIGDMFVEDDFEAISFGPDDDFTTTSATTSTTKSSAAKIVPVKVESTVDMDPFANIDNGFSDWNYASKDSAKSADKTSASRSRRRLSMTNLPSDCKAFEPKEEPKEHRRRSRRSSLDLALNECDNRPSSSRGEVSVSSGVSAKSNGSRGSRKHSSTRDKESHREGNPEVKVRGNRSSKSRSDRVSRRRASMGAAKIIEVEDGAKQSSTSEQFIEPRRTPKRASLNMVAYEDVPRRNARRASLNAAEGMFQTAFVSDSSWHSGTKVQEWDDAGFIIIR